MSIEKFLVDRNIARNKKQAEGLMIAVIILCLLFIGIKMFGGKSSSRTQPLSPEEIELLEAEFNAGPGGSAGITDPTLEEEL